jgi:1-acyl-sn-glycerol-3-phosphate acyltransferase
VTGRGGDLNGWWRFGLVLVGGTVRLLFRVRVVAADLVPAAGPAIVASNHVSALDGPILAFAVGAHRRRMVRFLVAAEFFTNPWFGWVLRTYRQIAIRRGEAHGAALDEAISTIHRGALAGIFPEGAVNADPARLARPHKGAARIALAARAPVAPVGIWGTQDRWPKGGLSWTPPWRTRVVIAFGRPIQPRGDPTSIEDIVAFTDLIAERIAEQVVTARSLASTPRT